MPPAFQYVDPFPHGQDETPYRKVSSDLVVVSSFEGRDVLKVAPEALTLVAREAFRDVSFLYRPSHLAQVAAILDDPEASANDRSVALALLRNAEVAAGFVLPMCQDTGTATIVAKKGQQVWTGGGDAEHLSRGVFETYTKENLRYSQTVPLTMYDEANSGTNLPAQIDVYATDGMEYRFLMIAKGGGSANKTYLFQETKALLNPASLVKYLSEKMRTLGTAACPPYHLAFVIGGTSAEACLKTVKLASAGRSTTCRRRAAGRARPSATSSSRRSCSRPRRRPASARSSAGSTSRSTCASSACRATAPRARSAWASRARPTATSSRRSTATGSGSRSWSGTPAGSSPSATAARATSARARSTSTGRCRRSWPSSRSTRSATLLSLTGSIVVARDIAHAKLKERLDRGEGLPQYFKDHPVYYAGPAKTPEGLPSGSFGPTTAGRMDSYVDLFQSHGGSMVMIAKGNRSPQVTEACKKHGGFYLGSAGGPAALLAKENIRKVELVEYPELGMEAIYKLEVVDFPAVILVDDKGNDFFQQLPKAG